MTTKQSAIHGGFDSIRKINLTACPICGNETYGVLVNGKDFEFHTGEYKVQRCNSCHVSYTNPAINEREIYKFYEDRNTPDFPNSTGIIHILRQWYLARNARNILANLPISKPIRIMDYGCGDGAYSLALSTINEYKVVAVDFHPSPPPLLANSIKEASNIEYKSYQSLNELEIFDVIFCRQVLEHIPNPRQLLSQLHNFLSISGFLIIEVPNIDSFWRKLLGKYYYTLYLPQHFYHFNASSLAHLVENEGFTVRKINKLHTPILPKSIQYLTGIKSENIGFIGLLTFPLTIVMDVFFSESTTLSIICQRNLLNNFHPNSD